jgi:hypothetical protein
LLTDPKGVTGRPVGRASARRPACFVAAFAVLVLAGCGGRVAPPDPTGFRPVLTRALTELRGNDPEAAVRLEALVAEAEAAQAAVAGRASAERAVRGWSAAMTCAVEEVARIRAEALELEALAAARIRAAGREVQLADRRAMASGSHREHARAAQAARLQLRRAESLAGAGDHEGALAAAEDAISFADAAQEGWRRQRDRLADPELRERWRRQVAETLEASRRTGKVAVVIDKEDRRLRVYRQGRQVAAFAAELGTAGLAPKRHAGDRATPEGRYRVVAVKTGGATKYYKALLLDYPNEDDRRRHRLERAAGTIPAGAGPGSLIEIHGHGGQGRDWTEGCVALRDEDMDRLLELAGAGTPVTIVGSVE